MLLFLFCFAPDEIWYIQTSLFCALFVAEVCVCVCGMLHQGQHCLATLGFQEHRLLFGD